MNELHTVARWSGGYVRDALGVDVVPDPGRSVLPVKALVGLALRRNPKRAHLLVSRVLAKHVPTEPGIATAAGRLLGLLVRRELQDAAGSEGGAAARSVTAASLTADIDEAAERLGRLLEGEAHPTGETNQDQEKRQARMTAVAALGELLTRQQTELPGVATIGYAETATGLGQLVAGQLGTYYIHSTRHGSGSVVPYGAFEELHSHATSHRLLPTSRAALDLAETVVLVDDELSTGATIINTIRDLHGTAPHRRYIVASLVDLRSPADRDRLDELATELGTRISAVALAHGSIQLPATLAADAAELIGGLPVPRPAGQLRGRIRLVDLNGVVPPIRSARFGVAGRPDPEQAAAIAAALAPSLGTAVAGTRVLVLATEEFMALPLAVSARLQELRPDLEIRYSTSTRSPIAALDEPGYAVRSAIAFGGGDESPDGPGPRFAYNFMHPEERFETVLIMAEPGTPSAGLLAPGKIADAVADSTADVRLVLLPGQAPFPTPLRGPAFGSYPPADVQWLLKDLSFAQLEAPKAQARSRHPVRQGQLRRVVAAGIRALTRVRRPLPGGAGELRRPDRARRRNPHRAGPEAARKHARAGVPGTGRNPGRES